MQRPGGSRSDETVVTAHPIIPYDVENDPTLQQMTMEPSFTPPTEEIEVNENQPESDQPVMETSSVEEEKPARKRRVSSGIKRKTVAPRKAANTTLKRTKKKASPPPEEQGGAG